MTYLHLKIVNECLFKSGWSLINFIMPLKILHLVPLVICLLQPGAFQLVQEQEEQEFAT